MKKDETLTLFWFRRDLRLHDNQGLFRALKDQGNVLPLFIFDDNILKNLHHDDRRVGFIYQEVHKLKKLLEEKGSSLLVKKGKPSDIFHGIIKDHSIGSVHANHDYEPYARKRDEEIENILSDHGIPFRTWKDQVIFEKNDILKEDGSPYVVFTPYSRKWQENFRNLGIEKFDIPNAGKDLFQTQPLPLPALNEIGFSNTGNGIPSRKINRDIIAGYDRTRDIPSVNGTSRLGIHLRFGTISIRELVRIANELNKTFLNELVWREFYMMILWHFPQVVQESFQKKYEHLPWENDEQNFSAWCEGKTGYPLVDAGMRELNETGYMHNRLRMITAGFLTKHLLTDWRWGEAYFAGKLLDYELSSNNGGWQWAAGTGTDAAPYFRIFNPSAQAKKFDPEERYIRRWIPELGTPDYPGPVVDHRKARERALRAYKNVARIV